MVIINYLFQLLLKKDTDSFFRLFFLKFKNLLDDYIVSYKDFFLKNIQPRILSDKKKLFSNFF